MEYIKQYLKNGDVLYASNVDYIENGLVIAYNVLTNHLNDFNNPHKVTLPQLGINVLAADINQLVGIKGNVQALLDSKVDKVSGKGLSTNDYTNEEKSKLAGIATGATRVLVDSSLSTSSTNPVQNKVVAAELNELNNLVGSTSVKSQIDEALATVTDLIIPITDEEIDGICGATLSFDDLLTDGITGITYKLYVDNGDLKMTETDSTTSEINNPLTDSTTGTTYTLYVSNGDLKMTEAI